jgi:hypothetical protein
VRAWRRTGFFSPRAYLTPATTPRLPLQPPILGGAPLHEGGTNSGERTQGAELLLDSSYIVPNGNTYGCSAPGASCRWQGARRRS